MDRPMYKAALQNGTLEVTEVTPEIWRRIGTQGLGHSKMGAVEILKRRVMNQFAKDMQAIDWQSLQYVKDYHDESNPLTEELHREARKS